MALGRRSQRHPRTALCREPTSRERRSALRALGETPDRAAVQDLLWAVLMQPEFGLIH